jgi:hypothetical protein
MKLWSLQLELVEPFAVSGQHAISNEVGTRDYIPATTIRGALAAVLIRAGAEGTDLDKWFGRSGIWYSNALPMTSGGNLAIPMPLSFVREKSDPGDFDGWHGVYNTVFADRAKGLPERTGWRLHQWTRLAQRWLEVTKEGAIVGPYDVDLETSMHVALHYRTRTVRGSALYSAVRVQEGQQFCALLRDTGGFLAGRDNTTRPGRVFAGKRRSAGYGEIKLEWRDNGGAWNPAAFTREPKDDIHIIHLLSDAILPNIERSGYRRTVTREDLTAVFEDPTVLAVESGFGHSGGWSSTWKLPRPARVTVSAGTVVKVRGKIKEGVKPLFWIGDGNREGFGWAILNPKWLWEGEALAPIRRQRLRADFPYSLPAKPWPGAASISPRRLATLAKDAAERARALPGKDKRLKHLLVLAQRDSEFATWNSRLETLRTQKFWKETIAALFREGGENVRAVNIDEVRFWLEAILAQTPRGDS